MTIKIPTYQADAFRYRPIIADIEQAVGQIGSGNPQPTIVIQAERGSGKTWLSLHLHRVILKELQSHPNSLLLCLTAPQELHAQKNEWFLPQEDALKLAQARENDLIANVEGVLEIGLGKIAKDLGVWQGEKPSIGELSAWILNKIQSSPNERWVILVDSVFEANWTLLAALEARLLGVLATMTNVLILITGRGKPYPWQSPYLRSQTRLLSLTRFGREEALQQIEYYNKVKEDLGISIVSNKKWEKIMEQSHGHPMANILLAQGAKIDDVIEKLLEIVEDDNDRIEVKQYLTALCPLDSFVENHLATMLDAYFPGRSYKERGRLELRREVLDKLIQTNLVHWRKGGYEIEENLRYYLRLSLQDSEEDILIWERLCRAAQELYKKWATDFIDKPETAKQFMEQARYFVEQANQFGRQA